MGSHLADGVQLVCREAGLGVDGSWQADVEFGWVCCGFSVVCHGFGSVIGGGFGGVIGGGFDGMIGGGFGDMISH